MMEEENNKLPEQENPKSQDSTAGASTPNQSPASEERSASPTASDGLTEGTPTGETPKEGTPTGDTPNQGSPENEKPADAPIAPTPTESHDRYSPSSLTQAAPLKADQYVDVREVYHAAENIRNEIGKIIIGQGELIELLLTGLFVGGHCLLEGLPGVAKTLTSKLLARTIDSGFSRIQFTPDLMPTDVTGTSVFNVKTSDFNFRQGPVFSNIILIDEINRAPAKTQAALMEVMEEKQITYDGTTYPMSNPFFVIATQNPIEQEGTYNLPEAQLDRFLFRIKLGYPSLDEEQQILHLFENDFDKIQVEQVGKIIGPKEIEACQQIIEKIHVKRDLLNYIAAIVHNTRNNGDLFLGASPRASLAIMKASKAIAAIRGRDFVTPDDIKHVAYPVLNHRVILSHEREMEGTSIEEIITDILNTVEIPR
jgi:MoxR-like ATPase